MWGEIAGAAAGLIGGVAQGIQNKKAQKRQFEYNEKAAANAHKRQLANMALMREWNSPAARKEQLQEAGLSTGLMYGGPTGAGGGAQATSAPQGGGATMTPPVVGMAMQNGIQGMQALSNMKLQEAQADNLDANTEKTKGVDTEAGYATIKKTLQDTENAAAQEELTKVQTKMGELQNKVQEATTETQIFQAIETYKNTVQDTIVKQETATRLGIDNKTAKEMNDVTLDKLKAETALLTQKILQTQTDIKLTEAQINKIGEDIKMMDWEKGITREQLEEIIRHNGVTESQGWTRNAIEALFGGVQAVGGIKQMNTPKPKATKGFGK